MMGLDQGASVWMGKAGSGLAPSLALVSSQGPGLSWLLWASLQGPSDQLEAHPSLC